ncbi:hypothetical protein HUB98_03785 [Paenibacillus barcinonensis]|uniref:Uncharacterized protein n=1 Tax=Paenibacillus barcinonensis TaxID=198119 RepID=A0A2V4VJL3_PAEBA|nr:hypothetical protein [Paenibacillus barcinonensis]PYE49304.1 hypothetical protein DFQ00_106290 [Paenibacillus barcinonensis]QKS55522.1 hypothetical protein HUB98_03785 [Paenibacillus barcinonensis]
MGYTHYWYRIREIELDVYFKILTDFKRLLPVLTEEGVRLAGSGGKGDPVINDEHVLFNGVGSERYEDFVFPRVLRLWDEPDENDQYFQFCKTSAYPYDQAVIAFLLIAKHHLQQDITVQNDVGAEKLEAAKKLCRTTLGLS